MNVLEGVDTTSAEYHYAIANSPYFLARQLRNDPASRNLQQRHTDTDLLSSLANALNSPPQSLSDFVRPLLILSAIAHHGKKESLIKANQLTSEHIPWYDTISKLYLDTFTPEDWSSIRLPNEVPSVSPRFNSMSGSSIVMFNFEVSSE